MPLVLSASAGEAPVQCCATCLNIKMHVRPKFYFLALSGSSWIHGQGS